jgi:hypothetical protein
VNGDWIANPADTILALQILSGVDMTGRTINLRADADGDGKIGLVEVILILETMAELRYSAHP